jgi:hypothetical protein
MADKMDYKKIRTDIINGKKRCVYMKPKGKREYVKSGGEFVSLSAYIKTLQKKNKKKGGGDGDDSTAEQLPQEWERNMSKTKNRPYYRNKVTGETTWYHPSSSPKTKILPVGTILRKGPVFSVVMNNTGRMDNLLGVEENK